MRLKSPKREGGEQRPATADDEVVTFFSVGDADFAAVVLEGEQSAGLSALSRAEQVVLAEVVAGRSNREIARERGTSLRTVTNQVSAIFRKLDVRSRSELALLLAGGDHAERREQGTLPLAGSLLAGRANAEAEARNKKA